MAFVAASRLAMARKNLRSQRRGTVALMFAICIIPLMMMAGLCVDYSFYAEAHAQLDMAADSAAIHAVRAAATATANGMPSYQSAGIASAQQWFAAQVTPLIGITITGGYEPLPVSDISITYDATSGSYTASVSYTGTVATHFGGLFKVFSWNIAGGATAVIANSFVEVAMLLDNSPSMLLPTSAADIATLEKAEMCSTQAAVSGDQMNGNYSWDFATNYGYGPNPNTGTTYLVPKTTPASGACDTGFDGDSSDCFYPPTYLSTSTNSTGMCPASTQGWQSGGKGYPAAPCAFACHNDPTGGSNDYYGLATSLGISLRFTVVKNAAATIIGDLQSAQNASGVSNQFSVGVYDFWGEPWSKSNVKLASFGEGTGFQSVYPGSGNGEAGTNLSAAASATAVIATPFYSSTTYPTVNRNASSTNFPAAVTMLAGIMQPSGTGGTATTRRKNLFIVTDGMADYFLSGGSLYQNAITPSWCDQIKSLGIQIYVLYTPYLPEPSSFYINNFKTIVEGSGGSTPAIISGLQSCASSSSNFYQASNPTDINTAMQAMLYSAINSPGRLTQ